MSLAARAPLLGVIVWLGACSSPPPPPGGLASAAPVAPASAPATEPPPASPASPLPASTAGAVSHNPLRLPPGKVTLDAGKRVFTFSEKMLAGARPGSTLVLYAANVTGFDGDDLLIESRGGPSYKVHPGYVIPVPDEPRVKPGDPVLTEWNGVMKHAVITKFVKDKVGVRYTDMDARLPEALLQGGSGKPTTAGPAKAARFVRQTEGLAPGNYAALRQGADWLHVLLVSASGEGEARHWLALGFGGAAMVVSEPDLKAIPVRYAPRVGAPVWAEWAGTMRRAAVQSADEQGLFVVKFERAGRPATVGWGLLMAPLEG
jgi:hypothetical protein